MSKTQSTGQIFDQKKERIVSKRESLTVALELPMVGIPGQAQQRSKLDPEAYR